MAIARAIQATALLIRSGNNTGEVGSKNAFGDNQLEVTSIPSLKSLRNFNGLCMSPPHTCTTSQVDVAADDLVFDELRTVRRGGHSLKRGAA